LPFLSELLEKTVQIQLQRYLNANGAMPEYQSAYRQCHSTETAVTKISNDLLLGRIKDRCPYSVSCISLPHLTPLIIVFS